MLRGEAEDFALEYACHSPTDQRWFRLVVTPLSEDRRAGAMVGHWLMQPTAVGSGRAAITAMRDRARTGTAFRLMLLDAHMSEMDGFAAAQEITNDPDLAGTAIVMLTATSIPSA